MRKFPINWQTWLSILDRYMLKEFALNLFAVTSVLWLIYVSTRFARYLAEAAVGNMPAEVIFSLLGLSSLGALSILLPIAAFLAVMLGLSRMGSDNELTIMSACGISRYRIMRNVLLFSGVVAVIVAYLSLFVVPNALSQRYEMQAQAKLSATTTGLIAGRFKESEKGDWTFYSERLGPNKQVMENVFIELKREPQPIIFRAESGFFDIDAETGNKFLVLENGYRYEGEAGQQDFTIAQFGSHSLLIEKGQKANVRQRDKSTSTSTLLERGGPQAMAEVQWRSATALMTLVLCVLAVPLAKVGPRQGRYAGFVPAVLVYILYSNLLGISRAWVAKETIPVWFGAVWVHILMIAMLLILLNPHWLKQSFSQIKLKVAG
jgi:lipopolysaccharide export system permease protein